MFLGKSVRAGGGSAHGDVDSSDARTTLAADARRGEPMFQRYCSGCHGVDGHGGAKNFMPHVGALTKKGYMELLEDDYMAHHRRWWRGDRQERLHAVLQDDIVEAGHCRRDRIRPEVSLAVAVSM